MSKVSKAMAWIGGFAVAVAAAAGFYFLQPKSVLVTDLYPYYPEKTFFFMEVAPGEKLALRFIRGVDRLKSMRKGAPDPTAQFGPIFGKDFEPEVAMGAWLKEDEMQPPKKMGKADPEVLLVMTLKSGVTPEVLLQDLRTEMSEFNVTKAGDATLFESKKGDHPPIAFHKNHLLSASSMTTLQQALAEEKTPETLLDNPAYEKTVSLLPAKRQGSLLLQLSEFQKLSKQELQDPGLRQLSELQEQMMAATPVTVAGVIVDKETLVHLDAYTPVDMTQIKNAELREDLKVLYQSGKPMEMAALLPEETIFYGGMVGLGHYYDLYVEHLANVKGRYAIESVQNQLKMLGLDLRKNLVSLLDGTAGLSILSSDGKPDFLVFLNGTPDTEKTFTQLGAMVSQLARGRMVEQKIDDTHSLNVLETAAIPVRPAYSALKSGTLVVGTQSGLETLYAVQQKKTAAIGENALYHELTASMPKTVNGAFFVDLSQGTVMLDKLASQTPRYAGKAKAPKLQEVFHGVEGVAGSNTIESEKLIHGYLAVKLTPETASAVPQKP